MSRPRYSRGPSTVPSRPKDRTVAIAIEPPIAMAPSSGAVSALATRVMSAAAPSTGTGVSIALRVGSRSRAPAALGVAALLLVLEDGAALGSAGDGAGPTACWTVVDGVGEGVGDEVAGAGRASPSGDAEPASLCASEAGADAWDAGGTTGWGTTGSEGTTGAEGPAGTSPGELAGGSTVGAAGLGSGVPGACVEAPGDAPPSPAPTGLEVIPPLSHTCAPLAARLQAAATAGEARAAKAAPNARARDAAAIRKILNFTSFPQMMWPPPPGSSPSNMGEAAGA
ncbi:hypothetical protein [Sinomonas sp. ASV322]|uniref:hypothetical protein n=1 Tax=Sinomonas sp. ASV322 TaxID=3041920 RepID=UPI0027DBCF8B|nr:hypothetical protein [Sinomonas sp. ASV322]MDQ4504018.1 hypothetical protein [Sinomonas sp. ASV322]